MICNLNVTWKYKYVKANNKTPYISFIYVNTNIMLILRTKNMSLKVVFITSWCFFPFFWQQINSMLGKPNIFCWDHPKVFIRMKVFSARPCPEQVIIGRGIVWWIQRVKPPILALQVGFHGFCNLSLSSSLLLVLQCSPQTYPL